MTLTEARKILEQHLAWCRSSVDDPEPPRPDSNDLYKAIEVAISALPKDFALPTVSARPTARERIAFIRKRLLDELGFDPFASRDRHRPMVYWRQCVMLLMLREGYRCGEVGRSCGYDHSTAVFARRQISGYLASGDKAITAIWVRLGKIVNV